MAEELSKTSENIFRPRQFSNDDNCEAHYSTTGPEIWWQLRFHGMRPDAFIAGVGTGGTVMGVGRYLRSKNPAIKIHLLEPSSSPTLSSGRRTGKHRIQGISDEFIPPIVDLNLLDKVISVEDGDSIIMAQKLASELGLAVGISSGANFIGALMLQNEIGQESVVVTVFPDSNKKYLSTDLLREEPPKEGFLSGEVELLRFRALKRVCHTCCNPEECLEETRSKSPLEEPLPICARRG